MFKKIILLLVLCLFIFCGCGKKQTVIKSDLSKVIERGEIIVGVRTDTYPFGYLDEKGNYAGYDIDIAKLIGKKIFGKDGKVKFVAVTATDRMMKLFSEDIDIIVATMSVTPSRMEIMDFSTPYYFAGQALLVKNNSEIKGLRDLDGRIAIIVFGSTAEKSLRSAVPNVNIVGYKTYDKAAEGLKKGRGDAIVSDNSILLGLALKDKNLKLLPKKYSKEPYSVAFRKGDESREFVKVVNEIIAEASRTGALRKMQKAYGIK